MLQKLAFLLQHYFELLVFAAGAWGYGRFALRRLLRRDAFVDPILSQAISITTGIGLFICACQFLAVAGQLRPVWVCLVVVAGVLLAAFEIAAFPFPRLTSRGWLRKLTPADAGKFFAPVLLLLITLPMPLQPPTAWDEVVYHLPHARQWALAGSLTVDHWLRYPWFPYNYELLYAAALQIADDVETHLLHALAGWLVLAMICRLGVMLRLSQATALMAGALWLILTLGDIGNANLNMFRNANSDMGVALFVFSSCIVFHFWRETRRDGGLLALAAFLLGVAAGAKYQALIFVPFFAVAVLQRERRMRVLIPAAACFLIPCFYWYGRNAWLAGDPVSPFGGKIFGFTDWNLADYEMQMTDLLDLRRLPSVLLWPALLVAATRQWHKILALRHGLIFAVYALAAWALTSGFPRYLMPVYPVLALLAAHVLRCSAAAALDARKIKNALGALRQHGLSHAAAGMLAGLLLVGAGVPLQQAWTRIAATPQERTQVINAALPDYRVLEFLAGQPFRKTYQFGIEYGMYYVPYPIWGDHLGQWRYRDFFLPPRDLHARLKGLGFQRLVVNVHDMPGVTAYDDFSDYFSVIYSDLAVHVYEIRDRKAGLPGRPAPRQSAVPKR